jgi:hypothetical protein
MKHHRALREKEKVGKPIKSNVVRPLQNLPVGPLGKSTPYGE